MSLITDFRPASIAHAHILRYGCSAFGVESFIQLRQRGGQGSDEDPTRPWDDSFALLPDIAKERFRRHGINFL